jgi:hypothetical protein
MVKNIGKQFRKITDGIKNPKKISMSRKSSTKVRWCTKKSDDVKKRKKRDCQRRRKNTIRVPAL